MHLFVPLSCWQDRVNGYTSWNSGAQFNLTRIALGALGISDKAPSRQQEDSVPSLVLDLGCGSGLSSREVQRAGGFCIGTDVSRNMLEGNQWALDLVQADMGQPSPFRHSVFDAVVSIGALHFLFSRSTGLCPEQRLRNCFQCLRATPPHSPQGVFQFFPKEYFETSSLVSLTASHGLTGRLFLDQPHKTKEVRWFLQVVDSESCKGFSRQCFMYSATAKCPVSCMWSAKMQLGACLEAEHHDFLTKEHAKYAWRLIRTLRRQMSGSERPTTGFTALSETETRVAMALLEAMEVSGLDSLIQSSEVLFQALHPPFE